MKKDEILLISFNPRVINAALAFSPNPRDVIIPEVTAMAFLVAPPTSHPIISDDFDIFK